jgi:hypothetical protein
MRPRRYRALALLLGVLVLGCNDVPTETSDKAVTSAGPPQPAGPLKAVPSRIARSGRPKPTAKTVGPAPTQGHVD